MFSTITKSRGLGFIISCFALLPVKSDTINFTSSEEYQSGQLNDHPDWTAHRNFSVNPSGQGRVSVAAFNEAIYQKPERVARNFTYRSTIDFSFTEADEAKASSARVKDVLNLSYYAGSSSGDMLKIGLRRRHPGFELVLHTEWLSINSTPPFTGGRDRSQRISQEDIGVVRDSDLRSDLLRLTVDLNRGANNGSWSIDAKLWNVSGGGTALIAEMETSGITFPASGNLFAGFGGGQGNSNSGFSSRAVRAFRYDRFESALIPVDPPPARRGKADLNQNGIPDLAELIQPAIAQFPPAQDSDGDGVSNQQEARDGTDPFDPQSFFGTADIAYTQEANDRIDFTFSSVANVRYRVEMSETLAGGSWSTLTGSITANGSQTTVSYDPDRIGVGDGKCFFRAVILPSRDADGDGLEDALERYLGFDPNKADSVRSVAEGGDYTHFFRLLTGADSSGGVLNSGTPGVPSEEQASRFFSQAAFGANEELISDLRSLGANAYEKWIDQQLGLPPTLTRPYRELVESTVEADSKLPSPRFFKTSLPQFVTKFPDYRVENVRTSWMRMALFAPDRLRQRMAWALSQIIVVGTRNSRYGRAHSVVYDLFLEGAFENYADLLYELSVNPLMASYLSSLNNRKADPSINRMPDENYAREIMQLFSIGLWELNLDGTRRLDGDGNPIPTYTNEDIVQVARVFTGLELRRRVPGGFNARLASHPVAMNDRQHDRGDAVSVAVYGAAEKIFLQGPFYSPRPLPAFRNSSRTGYDDIRDTVNILVNHPSCPPFISKNLIQQMVTSNPSPEYVERVARVFVNDGNGVRGNLGAVAKAILLDEEARSIALQTSDRGGRLKAPMLRTVALARALNAGSDTPAIHDLSGIQFWLPGASDLMSDYQQYPFAYPSVFNFFEPGFAKPGEILDEGLLSPEFQILNSKTAISLPNRLQYYLERGFHIIRESHTPEFRPKFDELAPLAAFDEALLDRLNLLLCHGRMSASSRSIILNALRSRSNFSTQDILQLAVYLVSISPDAAVLR